MAESLTHPQGTPDSDCCGSACCEGEQVTTAEVPADIHARVRARYAGGRTDGGGRPRMWLRTGLLHP